MAVSVVGVGTADGGNAAIAPTIPTGTAAGDVAVLVVESNTAQPATPPAGWNNLITPLDTGDSTLSVMWSRIKAIPSGLTQSGGASITLGGVVSQFATNGTYYIYAYNVPGGATQRSAPVYSSSYAGTLLDTDAPFSKPIYTSRYFNGVWLVGGSNGYLAYNANNNPATGWVTVTLPGSFTGTINDIEYGNGYYVAVGSSGKIFYTTNPAGTWSVVTAPSTYTINAVSYLNNTWAYTTSASIVYGTSASPVTGLVETSVTGLSYGKVAYGNGQWFIPLNSTAVSFGYYTSDIKTGTVGQTAINAPNGNTDVLKNSTYIGSYFIACAYPSGVYYSQDLTAGFTKNATPSRAVQVIASSASTLIGIGYESVASNILYSINSSTIDTSVTVADTGDHTGGRIISFTGVSKDDNPWDVIATGKSAVSTTAAVVPGGTTVYNNTMVLAVVGTGRDAASTTEFSGWANANLTSVTERMDNLISTAAGGGYGAATGFFAGRGAYGNTTATLAGSALLNYMSAALKGTDSAANINEKWGALNL